MTSTLFPHYVLANIQFNRESASNVSFSDNQSSYRAIHKTLTHKNILTPGLLNDMHNSIKRQNLSVPSELTTENFMRIHSIAEKTQESLIQTHNINPNNQPQFSTSTPSIVDILLVFTPEAFLNSSGNLNTETQKVKSQLEEVFTNSQISTAFNVESEHLINLDIDPLFLPIIEEEDLDDHIKLIIVSILLEQVRESTSSDVVILVNNHLDNDLISWLWPDPYIDWSDLAFGISTVQALDDYAVSRIIGSLSGAGPELSNTFSGMFFDSHAHKITEKSLASIMYNIQDTSVDRVTEFSNPFSSIEGYPLGTVNTNFNQRTVTNNIPFIANFYPSEGQLDKVDSLFISKGLLDEISLQWFPLEDAAYYNIYRSEAIPNACNEQYFINSTVETFYDDTNVSGDTTYYYSISAVDSLGNKGACLSSFKPGKSQPLFLPVANEMVTPVEIDISNSFVEYVDDVISILDDTSLNFGPLDKFENLATLVIDPENIPGDVLLLLYGAGAAGVAIFPPMVLLLIIASWGTICNDSVFTNKPGQWKSNISIGDIAFQRNMFDEEFTLTVPFTNISFKGEFRNDSLLCPHDSVKWEITKPALTLQLPAKYISEGSEQKFVLDGGRILENQPTSVSIDVNNLPPILDSLISKMLMDKLQNDLDPLDLLSDGTPGQLTAILNEFVLHKDISSVNFPNPQVSAQADIEADLDTAAEKNLGDFLFQTVQSEIDFQPTKTVLNTNLLGQYRTELPECLDAFIQSTPSTLTDFSDPPALNQTDIRTKFFLHPTQFLLDILVNSGISCLKAEDIKISDDSPLLLFEGVNLNDQDFIDFSADLEFNIDEANIISTNSPEFVTFNHESVNFELDLKGDLRINYKAISLDTGEAIVIPTIVDMALTIPLTFGLNNAYNTYVLLGEKEKFSINLTPNNPSSSQVFSEEQVKSLQSMISSTLIDQIARIYRELPFQGQRAIDLRGKKHLCPVFEEVIDPQSGASIMSPTVFWQLECNAPYEKDAAILDLDFGRHYLEIINIYAKDGQEFVVDLDIRPTEDPNNIGTDLKFEYVTAVIPVPTQVIKVSNGSGGPPPTNPENQSYKRIRNEQATSSYHYWEQGHTIYFVEDIDSYNYFKEEIEEGHLQGVVKLFNDPDEEILLMSQGLLPHKKGVEEKGCMMTYRIFYDQDTQELQYEQIGRRLLKEKSRFDKKDKFLDVCTPPESTNQLDH